MRSGAASRVVDPNVLSIVTGKPAPAACVVPPLSPDEHAARKRDELATASATAI
jgi:hypothetical protein